MSGGGSDRYFVPVSEDLARKIERARERERLRLDGDVNRLLAGLLAHFNDRDTQAASERLTMLKDVLRDVAEIDQILLGGSVAKHTAVSGLSDIDALVILDRKDLAGKSPKAMLDQFFEELNRELHRSDVASVEKGKLAITVKFQDGTEIQLLPALRSGQTISIAAADGKNWNDTQPQRFQRELTRANSRLNGGVVPAIKLFKSLNAMLPDQKQLTGYHMESLALDATRGYKGEETPRSLLLHFLGHASDRVLSPIQDKTGQSRTVDSYLGKAQSLERRNISQTLAGLKRRLEAATSVAQWSALFED